MQKTILVTGASKGFGFEIVRAALAAGDNVIASVRNNPNELLARLDHAPLLYVITMDVVHEDQVLKAVQEGMAHFQHIDVLVNNAGYGMIAAIEEASDAEIRQQYDTNVFGLLNVTRTVLPYMRHQRAGHIINISSMFGFDVIPGWGIYGSTKFAVEGLTKGLAQELAPLNIRVTAVEPGLYSTDFLSAGSSKTSGNIIADYEDTVGQMRISATLLHGNQSGDPQKLANAILQLIHTDTPPLHLLLGSDAIGLYRSNVERTEKDLTEWMELSMSTDHDHLQ